MEVSMMCSDNSHCPFYSAWIYKRGGDHQRSNIMYNLRTKRYECKALTELNKEELAKLGLDVKTCSQIEIINVLERLIEGGK
jgi:hypothetical protein